MYSQTRLHKPKRRVRVPVICRHVVATRLHQHTPSARERVEKAHEKQRNWQQAPAPATKLVCVHGISLDQPAHCPADVRTRLEVSLYCFIHFSVSCALITAMTSLLVQVICQLTSQGNCQLQQTMANLLYNHCLTKPPKHGSLRACGALEMNENT